MGVSLPYIVCLIINCYAQMIPRFPATSLNENSDKFVSEVKGDPVPLVVVVPCAHAVDPPVMRMSFPPDPETSPPVTRLAPPKVASVPCDVQPVIVHRLRSFRPMRVLIAPILNPGSTTIPSPDIFALSRLDIAAPPPPEAGDSVAPSALRSDPAPRDTRPSPAISDTVDPFITIPPPSREKNALPVLPLYAPSCPLYLLFLWHRTSAVQLGASMLI